MYDIEEIRKDFPILKTKMNGKPLAYLDNAATSQKPMPVIESIREFYEEYNANIHRGIYKIAEEADFKYEESKRKVSRFINAEGMEEIVYVRNTTEAINLVALTWGEANISKNDHILITEMEHHSNLVPWQLLAQRKRAILDYVKVDKEKYTIDEESLEEGLEKNPKLVAVTHVSNVLGTVNNIKKISRKVHDAGAKILVDGAQSAPHMKIDVKELDADFFAFSGHKMLASTGIGVLYGKREILENTEPLFGGGDMILTVEPHSHTWNILPWKFEAGTSNIEGGISLGAAIDYINKIGLEEINNHEHALTRYALEKLASIRGIKIYGPLNEDPEMRSAVISFSLDGIHPHDIAQIFDSEGIAIRAGHHCAMPLVTRLLDQQAVSRMSFYLYNTKEEIDRAVVAIQKAQKIFGR
ncbi:MAG: aminotransferase class V-fold PLP-dependent enzyme [Candidatus Micrarchaeia archaeon]